MVAWHVSITRTNNVCRPHGRHRAILGRTLKIVRERALEGHLRLRQFDIFVAPGRIEPLSRS